MSSDQLTVGVSAVLKTPLTRDEREEISEELYDVGSDLEINYEGTLLYQVRHNDDVYGISWSSESSPYRGSILEAVRKLEEPLRTRLDVDESTSKTFREVWYNGTDPLYKMVTLEDYLS